MVALERSPYVWDDVCQERLEDLVAERVCGAEAKCDRIEKEWQKERPRLTDIENNDAGNTVLLIEIQEKLEDHESLVAEARGRVAEMWYETGRHYWWQFWRKERKLNPVKPLRLAFGEWSKTPHAAIPWYAFWRR